jgi:hypothetical protein
MKNTTKIDKFWLLNFYFFTLFGYAIAVVTILIFPGAALYQCYRQTDRSNAANPYRAHANSEPRVSVSMFDQHAQAENETAQKISENQ